MPRIKSAIFLISLFLIFVFIGSFLNNLVNYAAGDFPNKEPLSYTKEAYDKCNNTVDPQRCYADFFTNLTRKKDIVYTASAVKKLISFNPNANISCHLIAHKVSRAEIEKDPKNWKEIIKKISINDCTGGYLHGALEAHIAEDPDFRISDKTINSVCDNLDLDTDANGAGCEHAMGHLLLVQNERDLSSTTKECNKLDENPAQDCLMGAFMEHVIGENLLAHGLISELPKWDEKRAQELEKLCMRQIGQAANACWRQIAHIYASISHDDPQELYDHCSLAPEKDLKESCYLHGIGVISNQLLPNPEKFYKICSILDITDTFFAKCLHSSITSVLNNSIEKSNSLLSLCKNTRSQYQRTCYEDIVKTLKRFKADSEAIRKTCINMPKNLYPSDCDNY